MKKSSNRVHPGPIENREIAKQVLA
jgi:Ubiquitin carboxyl-terminal hydrolase